MPFFFLAAVAFLSSSHPEPEIVRLYEQGLGVPTRARDVAAFRRCCLAHTPELTRLLATRRVQSNPLDRCALIMPALCVVQRRFPGRSCSLVDLGTSAGLHLYTDCYS